MIDQSYFIKKYNIDIELYYKAGGNWKVLDEIYEDYLSNYQDLENPGNFMINELLKVQEVHSIKMRIKDPEHLIEKIIRKKIKNPDSDINIKNYIIEITDLIGIRALHLFKEDWIPIHDFIMEKWDMDFQEKPKANVREGDPEEFIKPFIDRGLEINYHERGYRSVHYLIKMTPSAKKVYIVELQVRTIFEEGWSEIDHQIRYPYDLDNVILSHYLQIFNRLAGSADEMGSFVKVLKKTLSVSEEQAESQKTGSIYLDEKEDLSKTIKDTDVRKALKNAEKLCSSGNFSEAENILMEMDKANPDNIDILKAIVYLYVDPKCRLKKNEEILTLIKEKERYFSKHPEYYRHLAIPYMELRDEMRIKHELGHPTIPVKEKAIEATEKAIALAPKDPHLHRMHGYVYYWFSEVEKAINNTEVALNLAEIENKKDEIIRCKNNLAYYYAMTGEKDVEAKAREFSKEAFDYDSDSALYMNTFGFVKWKYAKDIEELKGAAEILGMAVKEDPFDIDFNRHLSECLQEIKLKELISKKE